MSTRTCFHGARYVHSITSTYMCWYVLICVSMCLRSQGHDLQVNSLQAELASTLLCVSCLISFSILPATIAELCEVPSTLQSCAEISRSITDLNFPYPRVGLASRVRSALLNASRVCQKLGHMHKSLEFMQTLLPTGYKIVFHGCPCCIRTIRMVGWLFYAVPAAKAGLVNRVVNPRERLPCPEIHVVLDKIPTPRFFLITKSRFLRYGGLKPIIFSLVITNHCFSTTLSGAFEKILISSDSTIVFSERIWAIPASVE